MCERPGTGSIPGSDTACLTKCLGIIYLLINLVASYGCGTTVMSISRGTEPTDAVQLSHLSAVVQSLGIRCRSSLRTRGVSVWVGVRVGCVVVREFRYYDLYWKVKAIKKKYCLMAVVTFPSPKLCAIINKFIVEVSKVSHYLFCSSSFSHFCSKGDPPTMFFLLRKERYIKPQNSTSPLLQLDP